MKKVVVGVFFQRVSSFIAIGKKTFDYYLSWGVAPSKIIPAKYCTDLAPFFLDESEAAQCRERTRRDLGIPLNAFVLLFVGRLFDRKRPQDLLEIHRQLQGKGLVHTVFVGNGELSAALETAGQKLPNLHWVGFKNQKEIKSFYYAADLLVVPSDFETWGLVVNEAFSCSLPALVTDQCGVAGDLVISGQTGEIFPVGDCEMATKKIQPLLADPTISRKWGQNARAKVLENYQPAHFARSVVEAFQKATLVEA
ncbi:glycosyltransferase [bacterium]|nr:glycosyltransferase [bacterium]